jgi:hypothetical protein
VAASAEELLKEWEEEDRELRELRRRSADWKYIESLPPRVREAVELYVEIGDIWLAAKLAGLTVDEFNEIRIKAGILW